MDTDNSSLTADIEYIEFGTFIYDKLYQSYWKGLPTMKDRLFLTQQIIDGYKDTLSDNTSKQALLLVEFLARQYEAIEIWDVDQFKIYKKAIANNSEMELLNAGGTNIRFLAFLRAIQLVIENIEIVYDNLRQGKGIMQGDLFIIENIRNPLFTLNADDLEDIKTTCYNQLTDAFENKINNPYADTNLFIETEIKEFSRLFNPQESSKGWEYLTERLSCNSTSDVEDLYQMRMKIIDGTYIHSLLDQQGDQRIICGKLFAIKEYVKYLKQLSLNKDKKIEKKKSELLLPDLLKNRNDINKINKWLLDKKFIKPCDSNDICQYKWIGKNDNVELRICAEINEHPSYKNYEPKTLKYSYRYQIGAFGYWLFKNNLLTMDTYNGSHVGRCVLKYYNVKATPSKEKGFRSEYECSPYLKYYHELNGVIEKMNSNLSK